MLKRANNPSGQSSGNRTTSALPVASWYNQRRRANARTICEAAIEIWIRANQKPMAKTSVDSRPASSATRLVRSIVEAAAFMLSFLSARGAPPPSDQLSSEQPHDLTASVGGARSFGLGLGAPPPSPDAPSTSRLRIGSWLCSRQKPRLGSLEQRNSPTQFLPAGGPPGRLLRARGPTPARWPSLFARAKKHGRIPLRTASYLRNSSRPAALRAG